MSAAFATAVYAQMPDEQNTPALPLEVMSGNGVSYINGGIGDEEVAELKAKASEFNLHVLLTAPQGEYLSDAQLRLLDVNGTVLVSVNNAGPYFYAHLQPGNYTIETSTPDVSVVKTLKIKIPTKGTVKQQIVFRESGGIITPHTPTTKLE